MRTIASRSGVAELVNFFSGGSVWGDPLQGDPHRSYALHEISQSGP